MKLTGNTVLITGGSSGIGFELMQRFISAGNKVIITGRNAARLASVKKQYPEVEIFEGDLTHPLVLDELVLLAESRYPGLNLLINNAAVQYNYSFIDEATVINKVDYEIAANLNAPVKLTALLLPLLIKNGSSAVVNVSSGLAITPKKSAPVYCATKAGLHSFTKALRYQLKDTGVKVFEIIPALIDTPMTEGRGRSKMPPRKLVDEFFSDFKNNRYESYIGKTKLLKWINRLWPALADRIMMNGL